MIKNLSFRSKLTLAASITSLFAVLASSLVIYHFAAKTALGLAENSLRDRIRDTEAAILIARASSPDEKTITSKGLQTLKQILGSQRLLKTGYFYVLDESGTLVLHPAKEGQNVLNETDLDGNPLFRTILSLKEGRIDYRWLNAETRRSQDKVAVCKELSALNWHVCASLNREEIFESVREIRKVAVLISMIAVLFAAIAAVLWSKSLQEFLLGISKRLLGTTVTLKATTQLVSTSSTRLSEAAHQQASAIQETVSAVEEIKAMVGRNADHTTHSQDRVHSVTETARQGALAVKELSAAIQDIVESNERIQNEVERSNSELGQIISVIQEIDSKTQVINDIVFQTKLLSFNASVEAARAGDHGQGFGVVAEEVGNLAKMSGKAANEISSMLTDSIQRVKQIVEKTRSSVGGLVEKNKGVVAKGSKQAGRCLEAFSSMKSEIESIETLISNIASASKEQEQGVNEISQSMVQLDAGLNSNAKSSTEVSLVTSDLNRQNLELTEAAQYLAFSILGERAKSRMGTASAKIFDAALTAHAEWKNRLIRLINGTSSERLDPAVVCKDDQCGLGKWIHGDGAKQFSSDPLFARLRQQHAKFHEAAAFVIEEAHKQGDVKTLIADGSNFDQLSGQVISDLISMKLDH